MNTRVFRGWSEGVDSSGFPGVPGSVLIHKCAARIQTNAVFFIWSTGTGWDVSHSSRIGTGIFFSYSVMGSGRDGEQFCATGFDRLFPNPMQRLDVTCSDALTFTLSEDVATWMTLARSAFGFEETASASEALGSSSTTLQSTAGKRTQDEHKKRSPKDSNKDKNYSVYIREKVAFFLKKIARATKQKRRKF